ncbi:MAG: B12-binding domain-containing radical SAM protein, partial [Spirochaetota bacterium]|nr:B12-binding domain-containing radical SAM protein [Spirochaetota bacterium]
MTKILLIHPKSPETFWQLTGIMDIVKCKASTPPLGLATVAALTPKGYDIKIIDEEIEDIDFDID